MIYPRHIVYSLEAMSYLACQPQRTYSKVHLMAAELGIPRHYLGKILTDLVKKELVTSIKGPTGGFALTEDPSKILFYDVIQSLGGLEKLEEKCVMGFSTCSKETPCAFHNPWSNFKDSVISEIQKLTLEEFAQTFKSKMDSKLLTETNEKVTV